MKYNDLITYLKEKNTGINLIEKKLQVNEEIQKLVLFSINSLDDSIYFLGGTNLRLCYNLDRYSEDLDFSYHGKKINIKNLNNVIISTFKKLGINIDLKWNTKTNVYKTFIKIPGIYFDLGISNLKSETVSIKLEIDINPPGKYLKDKKLLNSFLGKYVLQNYDINTTFSGKIGAVLLRPYSKGRDFYDLLWYFDNVSTGFNIEFLQETIKQYNSLNNSKLQIPENHKEVCNMILDIIEKTNISGLKEDIRRFTNSDDKVLNYYINNYKKELYSKMSLYLKKIENKNKFLRF